MNYQIGQIFSLERGAGIVGAEMALPKWYAIFVPRNREETTTKALKAKGCFAFYPKRTARWFVRGNKIERDFPQISGIIYAKFKFSPHWHIMRERKLITGVMSVGCSPIQFPSEVIRLLQGLPGRSEALKQARAELASLCVGDTVKMQDGILAGHFVQVSDVRADGTVFWFNDLIKGQTSQGKLMKEGNASEAEVQLRADEIMEQHQEAS